MSTPNARQIDSPKAQAAPGVSMHLLSGGMAGMVAAVTLQPLDLLKTRLQQQQSSTNKHLRTTVWKELRKLSQIKDLWRGTLPSMVRTSIGAGLYFAFLSNLRTAVAGYKQGSAGVSETSILPKLSPMENLTTGFVVRAAVGLITMPVTIVKTRFESNLYSYNSMYEGILDTYLGTGGPEAGRKSFRNFFQGSLATLARDCPYAGLYVLFYEGFKNDVMPVVSASMLPNDWKAYHSSVVNSTSAMLAASVATTITAPFDAIKTRLQLTSQLSIIKTTKILLSERGGVANLFRGLLLRLSRKGLSAGISWCMYEELIKSNFFRGKLGM